ncbi:MAG: hypothetical protein Kow0029_04140 [Candidatus Rifleibacteriota bacterium]
MRSEKTFRTGKSWSGTSFEIVPVFLGARLATDFNTSDYEKAKREFFHFEKPVLYHKSALKGV